jgi:hypothetical protein
MWNKFLRSAAISHLAFPLVSSVSPCSVAAPTSGHLLRLRTIPRLLLVLFAEISDQAAAGSMAVFGLLPRG